MSPSTLPAFVRSSSFVLLFALGATSAVGCASPTEGDDSNSSESETRIKPKGVDDHQARLIVNAPTGASKGTVSMADVAKSTGDAFDLTVGAGGGEVRYYVESTAKGLHSKYELAADLVQGKITTVELAGLRVKRKTSATKDVLGLGVLIPYTGDTVASQYVHIDGTADGTGTVLMPAGARHVFTWGFLDGMVFAGAAAGKISTADFGSLAGRMRATLVPPVRELPDACSNDDVNNSMASLSRSGGANATVMLVGTPVTIGFNPEIAGSSAPDVDYRLPCIRGRVALAYGSLGGAAKITKIGRLDVDHVDVTAPDGSISPRQGRYTVTDVSGRVTTLNGEYPTGTGIDVPPGTYKIDVTYFANSGDRKKFTQTVTTP